MNTEPFKAYSLSEIASCERYAIVDGPFGTQLHATEYTIDGGVPVVRVANTSYEGRFLRDTLVFITERKARILKRSAVKPGDVIVAKTGATIGKSAIFPSDWAEGIIASSCIKITVDTVKADNRFVAYLIQSNEGQRKIVDGAGGSTRATINTKPFGAITFDFAPRCEQAKIAEVLSTVDRAIEQTEALIAKQQRIMTGLMQDLLTRGIDEHGNLRSEDTHEFKDSALGRIPAEWDALKIDRIASHVGSGVTPTGGESVYTPEGVLFIRSQNVHFGGLRLDDVAYIPENIHRSMLRSEVFENDVLLNITGASIGRCCRMSKIAGSANVNQHVCAIRLREPTEARAGVMAAALESHIGQHQIAQLNAGGNREGLNYQQVRSFVLSWPNDPEEFTRLYSGMRHVADSLNAYQSALGKLRLLKTGLMQDLLTGNRRVTALLEEGVTA